MQVRRYLRDNIGEDKETKSVKTPAEKPGKERHACLHRFVDRCASETHSYGASTKDNVKSRQHSCRGD